MIPGSDVMSALEAAAFLGVHVETLRKLARRTEIPSFKVGRDWRFRKEALGRWAEQQRPHGLASAPIASREIDAQRARDAFEGKPSVLVVDDDEKVCRAMCRIVERLGCNARIATAGPEGLGLVAREVPDLILLDLAMSGMNGPEFLKELRKTHPELPVVIVTAYPDSELMERATEYAPLMLLAKPIKRELLERTVRMVLGERMTIRSAG